MHDRVEPKQEKRFDIMVANAIKEVGVIMIHDQDTSL